MAIRLQKKNFYKLLTIVNSRFIGEIVRFLFLHMIFTNEKHLFTNEKSEKKGRKIFTSPMNSQRTFVLK
jgi:hypothetical protein